MGPNGVIVPGSDQDYRYNGNAGFYQETNTAWVRFWATWDVLQPDKNKMPDDPTSPGYQNLLALDDQVNRARADGLNVIVTTWTFPRWSNSTEGLIDGSRAEILHMKEDRMAKSLYDAWYNNGQYNGPVPKPRKSLRYKVPDDLSTTGPWANWIGFLVNRYRDFSDGRIVAIEVCNEPNLQMFPLYAPNGSSPWEPGPTTQIQMDCSVAQMMQTASSVAAGYGWPGYLMAPATDDSIGPATTFDPTPTGTRRRLRYDVFMNDLLGCLDQLSFVAPPKFIWTHHNYRDVEWDLGQYSTTGNTGKNRAADVRRRLVNRWAGWPQSGGAKNNPFVFITEGGARADVMTDLYGTLSWESKQRDRVWNNWVRNSQDGNDGAGIGMIANYQFYTDPSFDAGLRFPLANGGGARAAYTFAWKGLPRNP